MAMHTVTVTKVKKSRALNETPSQSYSVWGVNILEYVWCGVF